MYEYQRDICDETRDMPGLMNAYANMGKELQQMRNYKQAIVAFKKVMQLSWIYGSQEYENLAYRNIALQHYYQGNVDRAKFYMDRSVRGKTEG